MGRGTSVFVASGKLGSKLLIFFGFGQAQVGQNYLQAIGQGEIYRNLLTGVNIYIKNGNYSGMLQNQNFSNTKNCVNG